MIVQHQYDRYGLVRVQEKKREPHPLPPGVCRVRMGTTQIFFGETV